MEYTTAVIEAVGVEHKETTRNYDILAGNQFEPKMCMQELKKKISFKLTKRILIVALICFCIFFYY